ncbi:MAG: hypothetical protein AAGD06_15485 [Acidobacteriota bacterium]
MRKTAPLFFVLLLLFALPTLGQTTVDAAPAEAPEQTTAVADVTPDTAAEAKPVQALENGDSEIAVQPAGFNFPSCFQVHGNPCQAGQIARCQWTPYEPDVCFCGSGGTFRCGGLP